MRRDLLLFLLLSLSCFISHAHPWGDLSQRHRRSDDEDQNKDKEKCHFAEKRTTADEREPRSSYSKVSEKCKGKMLRMSELMNVHINNLYQAPNYPALIMERGEGRYDIDWSDQNEVQAIGKLVICTGHEAELGRNWHNDFYHHFLQKIRASSSNKRQSDPICSMPPPFFQHDENVVLHNERHYIEADEAKAILKMKGVLIHPGLPVCADHNIVAQDILAQYTVQSKGHNIHPPPFNGDFSITPHITLSDLPLTPIHKSDPNYVPHPRENPAPINPAFVHPPNFHAGVKTAYTAFMEALGLDTLIAKKNWNELDERSQRRKAEALSIASDAMAHMMAPDDPAALKSKAFKEAVSHERSRPKEFVEMMNHVKLAFEYADSREERLAALSMVSHLHLPEIQKYLPGLTKYYHEAAKKYAARGFHLVRYAIRRSRINERKSNRLLEYLTSFKAMLNAPYGTRHVKDSYGKFVEIPNTIRSMRVGELYYGYKKDLEETGELDQLVPESTFRKVVRICKAERRKSLHGVDIFIADGMESFDRAGISIEKMLSNNWISKTRHDSLRSEMLASRQYLRTDFLAHGKEYSTMADHCWSWALSDPEDLDLQMDCQNPSASWTHSHSRICHQCENVHVWLTDYNNTLDELLEKHKNDKQITQEIQLLKRDFKDWEIKILKLKMHQLRTAKSENDRQWLVTGLLPGDVLLTADWAMKQLKLIPRESTSDWFGQRGMPWHIGHTLWFEEGRYLQHHFIHLFDGERQDSVAVTAILRSIFEKLKAKNFQRVFLRSDQAGCYKSSSTLSSMKSIADDVGIEFAGWYYSEAQAGKGPCDRCAATLKRDVRAYADSNHPVTTPMEFFEALTHGKVRDGYSFHLVRLEGTGKDKEPKISKSKIPDLSKYNAFSFETNGIRYWRYWNIGAGKTIPYKDMVANDGILVEEKTGGALFGNSFWMELGEPRKRSYHEKMSTTPAMAAEDQKEFEDEEHEEDEDSVCVKDTTSKKCKEKKAFVSAIYRCPIESCAKEFLTERNLEKHLTVGKHLRRPERENVADYALHHFSSFIEAVFPPRICPIVDEAISSLTEEDNADRVRLKMGWALSKRKRSTRFPPIVKTFLKKIYDDGERTGAKTDARGAEEMMRVATKPGGGMLFELEDLLTSRQIAGVFSGFKNTKLKARKKVEQKHKKKKLNEDEEEDEEMEIDEEEVDEVNALFDTEGDEELEYDTDPLFDEAEAMRRAVIADGTIIGDGDDEEDEEDDPMEI